MSQEEAVDVLVYYDENGVEVVFHDRRLKSLLFKRPIPILTIIISLICSINWILKTTHGEITSWGEYAKFGFYPYEEILNGKYWAFITSAFVHADFFHIFFNLTCILILGSKIEKEIGIFKYFIFVITSAIASSSLEVFFSQTTGIGISGVAYAFFGLLWVCGKELRSFKDYLTKEDFKIAVGWLVICFVFTKLKLMNIANFCHLGGFLWGISFGYIYILHKKLIPSLVVQAIQVGVVLLTIMYNPWSEIWLKKKVNESILKNDIKNTEYYSNKLISKKPEDPITNYILALSYQDNNNFDKAIEHYKNILNLKTNVDSNILKEVKINLAKIYIKQKKYQDAEVITSSYLKVKPNDEEMLEILGTSYLEQRKIEDAIAVYSKLENSKNKNIKAISYYNLACAYSINNELENALESLEKSIKINKEFSKSAKIDKDFENIKNDAAFIKLVQ